MIALSIRQPWASLILKAGKDIENRNWSTKFRGRILIHAAKGCTRQEFEDALEFAEDIIDKPICADLKTIHRGGIIGSVEIVDCVSKSDSPWFMGKFGFVLRNPQTLPFTPLKGQLGFFPANIDQIHPLPGVDAAQSAI
jgi:ASCH domain